MDITAIARPMRWEVDNKSPGASQVTLAGWDFGGDGPLALLHHANGMCGACWAPVAERLRATHKVVAIDARGHGGSPPLQTPALEVPQDFGWDFMVDDLQQIARQLMAQQGVEQIALGIGSSFGGIVTASAAARFPDLFARVYMFDPPIHPTQEILDRLSVEFIAPQHDKEALVARTRKRKSIWDSREQARGAWRDKPLFAPWTEAGFTLYLDHGLRDRPDGRVELACDPLVEAHIFDTTGVLWLPDFADRVNVPVELVHARQGFFPEAFFKGLSDLFAQGRFHQLDAGHMLPLEAPELVVDLINRTR
ncbi:MAG: alpha/beta hydrolase [Pseudomonadota bacterium]